MPTYVALDPKFATFVKAQVDSGRYNDAADVVRAALRLLQDQEELRRVKIELRREELQKGRLPRGEPVEVEPAGRRPATRNPVHFPLGLARLTSDRRS